MSARKPPTNQSPQVDVLPRAQPRGLDRADRDAIDEYNALVAKRGLFGDGRRRF